MSVSRLLPTGGVNDFNLQVSGFYTEINMTKEYPGGSYSITSGNNDVTLDIYAFNEAGTLVGKTGTKSFSASSGFKKLVIVGGENGDVLGFTYKTTFVTTQAGDQSGVPPIPISASSSSLPLTTSTTVISGYNFVNGMTATFIGTDGTEYVSPSVVVSSNTSATVSRPTTFPVSKAPYDLKLTTATAEPPIGSSAGLLLNYFTAGTGPAWTTAATALPRFTANVSYTTTVVASDPDPAQPSITYSHISGLPAGFTCSSTGVVTGTTTTSIPYSVTLRATNVDGDYADRTFSLLNIGPTWTTTSLTAYVVGTPYTFQLVATDDSGASPAYSLKSGQTLPAGLSLSSAGVISGTPTNPDGNNVIFVATDANGSETESSSMLLTRQSNTFTLATAPTNWVAGDIINISYTGGSQTFPKKNATSVKLRCTGAAGAGFAGTSFSRSGGAGGFAEGNYAITADIYAYVGGGGGTAITSSDANGGFNGGGFAPGSSSSSDNRNGSGGGGTDFRTNNGGGTWNNGTGLNSRIIVAGGGGGANGWTSDSSQCSTGGAGGGTNGNNGGASPSNGNVATGGTQSAGGTAAAGGTGTGTNGGFGFGGDGFRINTSDPSGPGGGGGWYGGGAGAAQNESGGAGGSGYIGGVTSGTMTSGGGTSGSSANWSTNSQGNGSAQVVILAI